MPQETFDTLGLAQEIAQLMPLDFVATNQPGNPDCAYLTGADKRYLHLRYSSYKRHIEISAGCPHNFYYKEHPKAIKVSPDRTAASIWGDIKRRLWDDACAYWDYQTATFMEQERYRAQYTNIVNQLARITGGRLTDTKEPWTSGVRGDNWHVSRLSIPSGATEPDQVKATVTFEVPLTVATRLLAAYKISQTNPPPAPKGMAHASMQN